MRATRVLVLVLVLAAAAVGSWWWFGHRTHQPDSIAVFYVKTDGSTLQTWRVTLGPARDPRSVAFYAAVQAVAGPPAGTDAVRFPAGTRVLGTQLDGATAVVDLSPDVGSHVEGSLNEGAEFKGLVYTLTALPGITAVRVHVGGSTVATLPGGHLELDEPLTRSSF